MIPVVSVAQAGVSILEYDKNGRVIGSRTVDEPRAVTPTTGLEQYVSREVLVLNPPADFEFEARRLGFTVTERVPLPRLSFQLLRLQVPAGRTAPEAIRLLRQNFPGLMTDLNQLYEPSARSSNFPGSQARAIMGWSDGSPTCGTGLRIGMIDGAVDVDHPALRGQRIEYRSFNAPWRKPAMEYHGTAVAAMMVGRADTNGWGGLVPGAQLKAANMFEVTDSGRAVGSAVGLLKAVDWIASKHVDVVNLSVAGSDNKIVHRAFSRAHDLGLVMVAAAGNWGTADRPAYPAAYRDVVAVTAIGAQRVIYKYANRGPYIDFAAPGVHLWTAVPGGGKFQSGTSFAAPYVTVLMGLEIRRGAPPSSARLKDILRKRAIDLGPPGRDDTFGWGLIPTEPDCRR